MKKSASLFAVLTLIVLFTGGCALKKMIKMAKDQELTMVPSPLELHGDSVKFELSAKLPLKMLKKNKTYTVKTWYAYADQKLNMPEVVFKSTDFPNAKTEQPKASKKYSFYYNDDMRRGDLVIQGVASNSNGKQLSTPDFPVGKGIITTSRMVEYIYLPAFIDHGYNNKEELIPTYVSFFFEQGSAKLVKKEMKGQSANFMMGFLKAKNKTRTVVFTGSHSPEGSETVNVTLADDRSKAVSAFYGDNMKKLDKDQIDSVEFVNKSVVRNWSVLMDTLKTDKNLTEEQKAQVIDVINKNKGKSFEEVQDQMKALPFYNKVLLAKVYPKLRTVKTEILTVKLKKTDAQMSELAKLIVKGEVSQDTLNNEEIAYAATLTPDLDEKAAIYKAAIKKNDAYSNHNNLAAVYLEQAKKKSGEDRIKLVDQAIASLNIAKTQNATSEVYNNLGVAYTMKGDRAEAEKNLAQAKTMSKDQMLTQYINSNLAPLKIRAGQYDQAEGALNGGVKDDALVAYNKGLNALLTKKNDQAETSLKDAIKLNENFASAYYLLAVTYARKGNKAEMAKNLNKAAQLDKELRKVALNDLEFMAFFTDSQFTDALR